MKVVIPFFALALLLGACTAPQATDEPAPDGAAEQVQAQTVDEAPGSQPLGAADLLFPRCDQLRSPIFIGCRLPGHPIWRN